MPIAHSMQESCDQPDSVSISIYRREIECHTRKTHASLCQIVLFGQICQFVLYDIFWSIAITPKMDLVWGLTT